MTHSLPSFAESTQKHRHIKKHDEEIQTPRAGGRPVTMETSLDWYLQRLRRMGAREVLWRSARTARGLLPESWSGRGPDRLTTGSAPDDWARALARFRSIADRPVLLDRDRAAEVASRCPELAAGVVAAAESAMNLSFEFFGYPVVRLSDPIDWGRDPFAGNDDGPDLVWSALSGQRVPGDVKWIWELNRLQHLPLFAQAWLFTGDERYCRAALEHLDSWIDQNPPGTGIAWRGAFEIGIRAISIAVALQGVRDSAELTVERFQRIVSVLAQGAQRCWRERSLFSSANNHLVGEMSGLAVVALMFPDLALSKRWEERAVRTLSAEAPKQVLDDGVGAEQAVGYQMFTVELLNLVAVLLAQRDGAAPPPLVNAVVRSSAFLAAMVEGGEPAPRFGDDDGGFVLRLGAQPRRTVREHLAIVASSGWGFTSSTDAHESLDSRWFGVLAQPSRDERSSPPSVSAARQASFVAPAGGLVVLRSEGIRSVMDVGPLGYLSIAAHGHADALSVTLSKDGKELVSDPGTSSYHGHPDWRQVMRGTRSHPTVCVDGQDQSVAGGPFLWTRHANVTIRGIDLDGGIVDAQHDGYTRLAGRVVHRRWLIASPGDGTHLVVDLLTGRGRHTCLQNWSLHPDVHAERVAAGHVLSLAGQPQVELLFAASAVLEINAVRGDQEADLGWWSDRLESRVPAWWLSATCNAELPVAMVAAFSHKNDVVIQNLSVTLDAETINVRWTEDDVSRFAVVHTNDPARVTRGVADGGRT